MLKIAVIGASGRMGRAVLQRVAAAGDLRLTGALTETGDPALGRDAGEVIGLAPFGVPLTDERDQALHGAQAAIDFTLPAALEANLKGAAEAGSALVIGTTGLEPKHFDAMRETAREIPLVYGRNMSIGVNVFMDLVTRAAAALGEEYDTEILEAHHRQKVDAPSGTALALGERVAVAQGRALRELAVYSRQGRTGPRVPRTVGFSVLRGGNIVGDHTVFFIGPDEQVELTHRARDRSAFARGALDAARWAAGRAPGYYSMADVLGLSAENASSA